MDISIRDFARVLIVIITLFIAFYYAYNNRKWFDSLDKSHIVPSNTVLVIAALIVAGIFGYVWVSADVKKIHYDTVFLISILGNISWIIILFHYRNIALSNKVLLAMVLFTYANIYLVCYKPISLLAVISVMLYSSSLSVIYIVNRSLNYKS